MSFLFKKIKASLKGKRGETYTNLLTAFTAVGKRSVNYKDVYISWPNNRTVQIDELLIARSGIYVVEVKNFKGWILGNMKNDHWTQCLYRKRSFFFSKSNKYKFYNPIKQNQGHINCLKYILSEYPDIPYHSIVVFSNDAVFKNIKYDKNKVHLIKMSRFRKTLKKIDKQYKDAISLDTYPSIIKAIENNISSTSTSKKEHINHAKEAQQLNTKIKCPVCGSYLVIRTAKRDNSQFYGCSSYPDCRYTRSIK